MKIFIALAFLAILASLGSAVFFMLRRPSNDANKNEDRRRSRGMARALTVRVLLSVLLFICLFVGWKLGIISPTGLPLGN